MKINKLCAAALSAGIAAAALTSTASAYIVVPSDKSALLDFSSGSWSMAISSSYAIDYSTVYQIQAIVKVTDEAAYLADKESGFYGDSETAFVDFQGQLGFGGSEWLSFGYTGLTDAAGDSANAAVAALGDSTYSFTANFGSDGINNTATRCNVTFAEWGNTSEDYALEVISVSFYAADGSTILSYNDKGYAVVEPAAVETTVAETTVPETTTTVEETTTTTTEATTTTTEETTTEAPETEAETSAEEETAAEETEAPAEETTTTTTTTTAAETTTAATTSEETAETTPAKTTAQVEQAVSGSAADFSKRDSQLMIFAIAAIAIIVIAIVAFIIIAVKRKR
ncbi:MAG: hypothetical protein IJ416_10070 [Ruminiclostridium sp.]|nr:hypothetical protein [Ruminiclostridium sp.]